VAQYLAPDLLYESVGFGTWKTPTGWSRGEETKYGAAFPETVFTQMLFFGDHRVATTTTYGRAFWSGDFLGVKAPKQWVTLRITDFYSIREEELGWGRVSYNFMMIDWADAFRQVGRRMLPKADLEEGLVLPPSANDGVPAPLSVLVQAEGRDPKVARRVSEAALVQDWSGEVEDLAKSWHSEFHYWGPGGIGLAQNTTAYRDHVLLPFRAAFAGRRVAIELSACEGNYCAFFGRMHGEGVGDWLGLPTRGRKVALRFAMHFRVVGDKVAEGWTIFDFPGLFEQLGMDFFALAADGGRL
jgi:predicted ester cyclase